MEKSLSDPMTTSQGPVLLSDTEAMLAAERNHSSVSTSPTDDALSNGLLPQQPSGPKQNGHTNDNGINTTEVVHHSSNGHSTANGKVFDSEVYVK